MNLEELHGKTLEFIKGLINNSKDDGKKNADEIENKKTDKRKLIDEVAGMMKSAGCDDEEIRTAIGKMEKIGYDKSEDGTADNQKGKKDVKNKDEEDEEEYKELKKDVKKDVENKNKCDNSVNNGIEFYNKLNKIYNSAQENREEATDNYISKADRLKAGEEYFSIETDKQ